MRLIALVLFTLMSYSKCENCDFQGNLIYEDLGCKPVFKEGRSCPVKFDCNFEVKNNTCLFRGTSFEVGQKVTEDIYGACLVGCSCRNTDKFQCAILDCPRVPLKFKCYTKYGLDKCCSIGQYCSYESGPPFECKVDGEVHNEFTQFGVKDSCLSCVCNKGYEGKNEAPFCKKPTCAAEIRNSEKIHKYCAPLYGGNEDTALCCPFEWVCPSENDKPLPSNPKADPSSDLRCKFGDSTLKLGERIKGQYKRFNNDNDLADVECECRVPPLLTCREVPKPIEKTDAKTNNLEIRPIPKLIEETIKT